MPVSTNTRSAFFNGSPIRRMFEEGLRLKALHGAENVADVSIGSPDFEPPRAFTEALHRVAARPGDHGYMLNAGYPDVRRKVAAYLDSHGYLPGVGAEKVIMTTGAAGALNVVLKTILNPGDEVIVLQPFFLEYRFYVDSHGGRMRLVDTHPDGTIDIEAVDRAINRYTRAILVNSPNNPTGRVYSRQSLEAFSDVLRLHEHRHGHPIFLISDEPYRELLFDGVTFTSPAAIHPNSFLCYSWSKSFSIPGERIGYVAVNPALETDEWPLLMGSMAMCNRFLGFINAPAFMQHVIGESMDAPIDIGHYVDKRERLCATLDEAGYEYRKPEGTFYIFPKTPCPEEDFIELAKQNLLLVVPGSAFGREGHFRVSFAVSDRTVDLACEKLKELVSSFA